MTHRLTTDGAAVITPNVRWLPITPNTPYGARMMLIEKSQGVAYIRVRMKGDGFDHWHPLPTFKDPE